MKAITISAFRKRLKEYFDFVTSSAEVIVIPRGKDGNDEAVVVMSLSEYNSFKDTEHLLSTRANRNRLRDSIDQIELSQTVRFNPDDGETTKK
ncbi:MAG: prevent-host-death protein [Crocinitomix sp.]|nr:prevent-host-death protein [Crocinitomix sp.]